MQFRRRVPRQPASWDGICQIEGEFAARCRVVDISMLGVGITFNHLSPSELLGRCISVEVPTVGDSISIQLKGKVTNVKSTRGTAVRVGIEFDRPSESRLGTSIVDSMMTDTMGAGVHRTSAPWGAAG